jgi:internalin A
LSGNPITSVSVLPTLTLLTELTISPPSFSDLSLLGPLNELTFGISDSQLSNLAPLSNFPLLTELQLNSNEIVDIAPVGGLTHLTSVGLVGNHITTLSPLVASASIGSGDTIQIGSNPLNCTAQASNVATLRARGVTVSVDCP